MEVTAHDYRVGGVSSIAFCADGSALVTCGRDGVLACHKWK